MPAFIISAALLAVGAGTHWFWPFHQIADMDRSLMRWPEPQLLIAPDRGDNLVLVRITYTVLADKKRQFLQAMTRLRQSRQRTGATAWTLHQDGRNLRLMIEQFGVASWESTWPTLVLGAWLRADLVIRGCADEMQCADR